MQRARGRAVANPIMQWSVGLGHAGNGGNGGKDAEKFVMLSVNGQTIGMSLDAADLLVLQVQNITQAIRLEQAHKTEQETNHG